MICVFGWGSRVGLWVIYYSKEPESRCSVPVPKPSMRKAEQEGTVDLSESQDDFADKKHSVCTQKANKEAQRVSLYVLPIGRRRKQAVTSV